MNKAIKGFLIILPLFCAACSNNQSSEPFQPLAKITSDPRHESAFNATEAAWQAARVTPMDAEEEMIQKDTGETTIQEQSSVQEDTPVIVIATEASPFSSEAEIYQEIPQTVVTEAIPPITLYGTSPNGQNTYQMQNGDTLSCIGRRFNRNLEQLMQVNGIQNESTATAGTVLIVPGQSGVWSPMDGPRTLRAHPTTWQVQSGDTLFSIACAFGPVFPEDIAAANGLELNSQLTVGQQINVP